MTLWQEYHVAHSVEEALRVLAENPRNSKVIAGGTDLLLELQQGLVEPVQTLVDITQIPDINLIEIKGEEIFVGAAVPHNTIAASKIIVEHCTALAIASGLIGGPQVRNAGTIGGNIAHALPAADATIALVALDAQVEIAKDQERRRVPITDIFKGPGESSLNPGSEIITGFYIGLSQEGQASTFKRIMRPQGVAIAILNLALWLQTSGDEFENVRLAIGPSGPVPRRLFEVEEVMRGQKYSPRLIEEAYKAILSDATFRTSRHRATKGYREKIARVLLEQALSDLVEAL
jgi:carbon-monoxide dehydrogenase medium subunit